MKNTETKEAPAKSPAETKSIPERDGNPLKVPKKMPGKKPNPKA